MVLLLETMARIQMGKQAQGSGGIDCSSDVSDSDGNVGTKQD
jgi:hypothetical protein